MDISYLELEEYNLTVIKAYGEASVDEYNLGVYEILEKIEIEEDRKILFDLRGLDIISFSSDILASIKLFSLNSFINLMNFITNR